MDTPTTPAAQAADLTRRYPAGTPCVFWPGARLGPGYRGLVRSPWVVSLGGDVVVWVEGYPGYIAATHVECFPGGVPESADAIGCYRCRGYGLANWGRVRVAGASDTDPCPVCRGWGTLWGRSPAERRAYAAAFARE